MNNLSYLLLFIFVFIANTGLTAILIKPLTYFKIVDVPKGRRAHNKITPRGGGLAIILVTIIALSSFEYLTRDSFLYSIKLIPLLSFIAVTSFLDDIDNIPPAIRLLVHLICATLAIFFFLYPVFIFQDILPLYANFILVVISLTAFINIYNFMDGIDGISCAQSIHLSITLLLLCYCKSDIVINLSLVITLNIIILASSLSFLIFNRYPARIFLGDVGSIGLGFLIGLNLVFVASSSLHLLLACFICSLYYLADSIITILIRIYTKEKFWEPHLQHFFQKAVRNGKTHKEVVTRIMICNIFLMCLAVSSLYFPLISITLAVIIVSITLIHLPQ